MEYKSSKNREVGKMKRIAGIAGLLVLAVLLMACDLIAPKGQLVLNLSDAINRTLLPDISMEVHHYEIYGTGPSGAQFAVTGQPQQTVTVEGLRTGLWHVMVDAYNANSEKIGSTSGDAEVLPNQIVTLSMIVVPLEGNGRLRYTLTWPSDAGVAHPQVTGTLFILNQDPIEVTVPVQGTTAVLDQELPAGYSAFSLTLKDGDKTAWTGNPVACRIVANQTTSGRTDLQRNDLTLYGDLAIQIGADLQNPLQMSLSAPKTRITTLETLVITASLAQVPSAWAWYLDGSQLQDSGYTAMTVGPNLAVGRHRLTLLVLNGVVLSSADFVFEVEPAGGFVEDFNDGLAQGWNLHGNFAVQNAMLYSNPAYTDSWKGCEYGQSQFAGAFEYKVEYHTLPG